MGKIKDAKIEAILNDIERIQRKTNMYIFEKGKEAAFHLMREIWQNSADEINDPDSNGTIMQVIFDLAISKFTCIDTGRGFPEHDVPLDIVCTTLQSGSKFNRVGGATNGEFGVGITCCNALSEVFEITSFREEEKIKHYLKFVEGKVVEDKITKLSSKDMKHGTIISFIPSKKYLGEDAEFPVDDCIKWIENMFYFPMSNPKFKCDIEVFNGMELVNAKSIKQKNFSDLLSTMISDSKYAPTITFNGDKTIEEIIGGKKIEKNIRLDVSLTYENANDTIYDSYCNYTRTVDGGVHIDAVNKSFCSYMQNKTKSKMTDNQKDKTPIIWDDVRNGLRVVVSIITDAQVMFQGNAKTKITNDALVQPISNIVVESLDKIFTDNPNILDTFIKIIKLNSKARVEMQELKTATQTEKMNTFKDLLLDKYTPANNHGKGQFRQIFLCEGDSAGGSIRDGGNPDTDAILRLRGVTVNAAKCKSVADLMKNREVSTLVNVLRCGIGKNFNIDNLWFDRIYIATDADTDGDGISDQLITIFYLFFPEIIRAGKLYKLLNPLYHLDDGTKKGIYVKNREELIQTYHSKITKVFKIKTVEDPDAEWFTKEEFKEFLEDTYDYRESLIRAAESLGKTDKFLVEMAVAFLVLVGNVSEDTDITNIISDEKFVKKYISTIQKKYKEISFDEENNLRGIVDGKYCLIKISNRLLKKTSDLLPIFNKYGYKLIVKEKDSDPVIMTIGEFLDSCMRFWPSIRSRFKGLTIN